MDAFNEEKTMSSPTGEETAAENSEVQEQQERSPETDENAAECMQEEPSAQEACEDAECDDADCTEEEQTEDPQTGAEEEGKDPEKEDGASGNAQSGKKLNFFGKKKDKRDEQIKELKDRVQRQMAEFDNFRKRTEREKASMYEIGAKGVVEKILPVVDNFERGLEAAGENSEDPFVVGMQKIYKQLMTALEDMGVRPIEAVGKTFDPDFHNAVMHVEDPSVGENVITQELQKGYMYGDSVVRHSMVTVAN